MLNLLRERGYRPALPRDFVTYGQYAPHWTKKSGLAPGLFATASIPGRPAGRHTNPMMSFEKPPYHRSGIEVSFSHRRLYPAGNCRAGEHSAGYSPAQTIIRTPD